MALVTNTDNEDFSAQDEALLQSIRQAEKPFSWPLTKGVEIVSVEAQEALALRIEEGQQAALEETQRLASEAAESAVDLEAQFTAALEGAVAEKALAVPLAEPGQFASEGDRIRWRERVAADERAKLELAANPPDAEDQFEEAGFFADLDGLAGEAVEAEVDAELEDETDELDESLYLDWAAEESEVETTTAEY